MFSVAITQILKESPMLNCQQNVMSRILYIPPLKLLGRKKKSIKLPFKLMCKGNKITIQNLVFLPLCGRSLMKLKYLPVSYFVQLTARNVSDYIDSDSSCSLCVFLGNGCSSFSSSKVKLIQHQVYGVSQFLKGLKK